MCMWVGVEVYVCLRVRKYAFLASLKGSKWDAAWINIYLFACLVIILFVWVRVYRL